MTIARARHADIEIAYETFGGPPGDPLLLVMGVGAQMVYWHDGFCSALVGRGFWVARFDNRDAGLSTHLPAAGEPDRLAMLRRPSAAAVYRLEDMADDALVVHGEADPLIRIAGGRATAAAIPGARLVTFPGMGHDLPRELWPAIAGEIRALADVAQRRG